MLWLMDVFGLLVHDILEVKSRAVRYLGSPRMLGPRLLSWAVSNCVVIASAQLMRSGGGVDRCRELDFVLCGAERL